MIEDMEKRLISKTDLIGNMAKYAVTQHPYNNPPRLHDVVASLSANAHEVFKDGTTTHPMCWVSDAQEILVWLRQALRAVEDVLQLWNTPSSGHTNHVFVSRYDGPRPEDDFIDIDALLGNVARSTWSDAAEYSKEAA